MFKRLFVPLLVIALVISFSTIVFIHENTALAASYVGATTTGKFHYVSCRWADKIRPDHRAYFESREEATDAGYIPCKVCKP